MARKKRKEGFAPETPSSVETITKTGKKIIAAGIVVVVLGFIVLTQTDPMGRNWASNLSPFLILGGYAIVALGILCPEPPSSPVVPPSQTN